MRQKRVDKGRRKVHILNSGLKIENLRESINKCQCKFRVQNQNQSNDDKFELNLNQSQGNNILTQEDNSTNKMLQSLPFLRKQLDKIHGSDKLNPESKIEKYQKKILQLLIRQKTTLLQNEQLNQQLQYSNTKLKQIEKSLRAQGSVLREKQQENVQLKYQVDKLTQNIENLDIQNKMNQMGRMSQEEKYSELLQQFQSLQKTKLKLQGQLSQAHEEINRLKAEMQHERERNQISMKKSELTSTEIIAEKDQTIRKLHQNLQQSQTQLQSYHDQITSLQQTQLKLQQKITQLLSSQNNLKQKLNQMQSLTSQQLSKINQLTKQLHLIKLKNKQYEQSLYTNEIQQGEQSLEFSKLDKENKKIKKQLTQLSDKIKQLQDEKALLQDKNDQLNKNYKNTKKELQKLKDSLSQANDNQTGIKSRIDKLQLTIKSLKQSLSDKQEQLISLKQRLKQMEKQSQLNKNQAITSKFNLQEMKKKYDIVVEARSIAQEKLVLERQEHSKSLSSMIKQKDLSYRQNYKLLQLLQIKDKTIDKIFNGLKNLQQLQKELPLEITPKQHITKRLIDEIVTKDITSHKDRVKLIDEHLQKFKL